MITGAQLQTVAALGQSAAAQLGALYQIRGVNLAGADFGTVPGVLGTNYTFPTIAELGYYFGKKMKIVRLPFLWERIQPVLGAPLDSAHINWLTSFAQFNTDMNILLDVHSYGGYNGAYIEMGGPTKEQFADLWSRLATVFAGFTNVQFGLMNEPHAQTPSVWLAIVNTAIAAIRAAGATNLITVPGLAYAGAWSFVKSGSAAALINVVDPGNNSIYEVHQYFDYDGSGTSATAVSATVGSERLTEITNWARKNQKRLLLGEFGAANNQTMLACLADCVAYMRDNADVWAEWTYWAGGPWWGAYLYSIEPVSLQQDSAQMTDLVPYL